MESPVPECSWAGGSYAAAKINISISFCASAVFVVPFRGSDLSLVTNKILEQFVGLLDIWADILYIFGSFFRTFFLGLYDCSYPRDITNERNEKFLTWFLLMYFGSLGFFSV